MEHAHAPSSLNHTAFSATVHCLTGCAIGEVLGMVIGTALSLHNAATIAISILLAFFFGYALTMAPMLRGGMSFMQASRVALLSDTASIAVMEVVDNLVILAIPNAMNASLGSLLFWGSLAVSLVLAGIAAFPINRWLISRGQGHAHAHRHHHP